MISTLIARLLVLSLCSILVLPAPHPTSQENAGHHELTGDTVGVLNEFARACKVPMLIEIAQPLQQDLHEALPSCDPAPFFAAFVKSHPIYAFEVHGRAVHIYERSVVSEKEDFLNWQFQDFVLPANVAQFKNLLTARLGSKGLGTFGGGLVHGLLPNDLVKRPLPKKKYMNTTAREILLDVLDMDGSFYNIIVFPKQRGLDNSDIQKAYASWQWRSVIPESGN